MDVRTDLYDFTCAVRCLMNDENPNWQSLPVEEKERMFDDIVEFLRPLSMWKFKRYVQVTRAASLAAGTLETEPSGLSWEEMRDAINTLA